MRRAKRAGEMGLWGVAVSYLRQVTPSGNDKKHDSTFPAARVDFLSAPSVASRPSARFCAILSDLAGKRPD